METLVVILALIVLAIASAAFGADSRSLDVDRVTSWWPANPRDSEPRARRLASGLELALTSPPAQEEARCAQPVGVTYSSAGRLPGVGSPER